MTARHAPTCAQSRWDGPCICPEGGGLDTVHGFAGRWSPLLFVEAGPEAHGYVVDSFCKSFGPAALALAGLGGADVAPDVRRAVGAGLYRQIKTALERSRLVVGVNEERPTTIVAAALYEPSEAGPCVHWLYVTHTMRRRNVGRATLEACGAAKGGTYTHHTPAGAALARRFSLLFTPENA